VPKRYLERLEQPVSQEWLRSRAGRPWHAGDLVPVPAEAAGDQDPARVLAAWWREVVGGAPDEPLDLGEEDALPEVPLLIAHHEGGKALPPGEHHAYLDLWRRGAEEIRDWLAGGTGPLAQFTATVWRNP
jgi:hypothetical protein